MSAAPPGVWQRIEALATEVALALAEDRRVEEQLHALAVALTEALDADRCIINRVDEDVITAVSGIGLGVAADPECASFPRDRGIVGRALRLGRTQLVDDVLKDPDYYAATALTRSEIATPVVHDGRVVFVLNVESNRIAAFSAEDAQVLEAAAALVGDRLHHLKCTT